MAKKQKGRNENFPALAKGPLPLKKTFFDKSQESSGTKSKKSSRLVSLIFLIIINKKKGAHPLWVGPFSAYYS